MFFILGIISLIIIVMYVRASKAEEEAYRRQEELISRQNRYHAITDSSEIRR